MSGAGLLDKVVHSVAAIADAALKEAGGVSVAADAKRVEIVVPGNRRGVDPVEDVVVNVLSFGVIANRAFAGVAGGF